MNKNSRNDQRRTRAARVRAKIAGTPDRPRVSVFRSLVTLRAQVIDDLSGATLCSATLADLPKKDQKNTVDGARALGLLLAKKCAAAKITTVVFDRAGYAYHGKVHALADGLREGGIAL